LLPLNQFEELPQAERAGWLDDPYFACLQHTFELAANMAVKLRDPPEHVQVVCDEQPKVTAKAERLFRACQVQLKNGSILNTLHFASSKQSPGLQVADLIAYEALRLRRDMCNPEKNVIDEMRWPMQQLFDRKMTDFEFYTAFKLCEIAPVKL
jgi:hypothetical protein